MTRYAVDKGASTVLVAARSSMGAIVFESRGLTGFVDATVLDGGVASHLGPKAVIDVELQTLRSGNDLYDAELMRRIDVKRMPYCRLELGGADPLDDSRFAIGGDIEFHGERRHANGTIEVESATPERLVITGSKQFDIRDFGIPPPGILIVKIYPEVQVQLFLQAHAEGADPAPEGEDS